MSLQEYFRLPKFMRLSRNEIAKRMTQAGCEITPEAIGKWVKNNKVPESKKAFFYDVLRDESRENGVVDLADIEVMENGV